MFLPLSLFGAALVHSTAPLADGDTAPSGEDIVVTAQLPRPPAEAAYGEQTLSAQQLRATASGRLEEALARIPGFQQFRRSDSRSANPSAQGVTLRAIGGNAASRTLLLLDGVPLSDAFFGSVPFTAIPVDSLQSATVTRGSGVGPFGAGAVAGVIALTSQPADARPPLVLDTAFGSRSAAAFALSAAAGLGGGHVALDVDHARGAGFFTTPADQRVSASVPARYRGTTAALSADLPLSPSITLFPRIALFRDDRILRFAGADSRAQGVDAALRLLARGRWQVEAIGWLQARDFSNIVVSAASLRPTLDQRATPSSGWGGKIELRPPSPVGRLTRFGIDLRGAAGRAIEDSLAANGARTATRRSGGRTRIVGAFAEQDVVLGRLALTGGARIDHWQLRAGFADEARADGAILTADRFAGRHGTLASFRGGAAFTAAPWVVLRGAAYNGWRLPTLNELYRPFVVFPVTTRANAALLPERLVGAELSLELRPAPGMMLALTGFDNRLRDAIANVSLSATLRQRRNVRAIAARGIEASLQVARGPWRIDAGYAFADARVDAPGTSIDGLRPAQTARHAGSVTLGWQGGGGRLLQLGLRHTGAQFEDDRNVDRLPPATTLDALIAWPLRRGLTLGLRGENLADARVVTRKVGGSVDLGAPRTLWIDLRFAIQPR